MASKSLKIFYFPLNGVGHQNACIGMGQTLAKRGHQIYFIHSIKLAGFYEKYGFKEILLADVAESNSVEKAKPEAHPITKEDVKSMTDYSSFANKSSFEQLDCLTEQNTPFVIRMYEEMLATHVQLSEIIDREQPDLIIVDHIIVDPCISYGKIPWIYSLSGNAIPVYDSEDLPPMSSGYPTYDRTNWDEFRQKLNKTLLIYIQKYQNKLNKYFGYPETDRLYCRPLSPYLNLYAFPKELDYNDIVKSPENSVRVDTFSESAPKPFQLPEEFKAKIQPNDKLIYLSLGSMCSIYVGLMAHLVDALSKTPHKYIISKGPKHDEYQLADNMWGEAYLPQMEIIPMVDLVITHGGNNTVTETFLEGKPMVVMPVCNDQWDNAQRIAEKGYGVRVDAFGFQDETLIQAIDRVLNDREMHERCRKAAQRIRESRSKENACLRIEELVAKFNKSSNV